jgi:hypothetical protein
MIVIVWVRLRKEVGRSESKSSEKMIKTVHTTKDSGEAEGSPEIEVVNR